MQRCAETPSWGNCKMQANAAETQHGSGLLRSVMHHTLKSIPLCRLHISSEFLSSCPAFLFYISVSLLTLPLLFSPHTPSEGTPSHCLQATVLQDDGLGRECTIAEGGCGALQCSMTDGSMDYFLGELDQRWSKRSILATHGKVACSLEKALLMVILLLWICRVYRCWQGGYLLGSITVKMKRMLIDKVVNTGKKEEYNIWLTFNVCTNFLCFKYDFSLPWRRNFPLSCCQKYVTGKHVYILPPR